jgi:hypothetical protein
MAVFPTAGHLASWARQAPQVRESAGKRKGKNATGRGNPYWGAPKLPDSPSNRMDVWKGEVIASTEEELLTGIQR